MTKKLHALPDLEKRPRHRRKKPIKVNSFSTAVAAMAEKNSYHGPQLVKKKTVISDEKDAEPIEDLLKIFENIDWQPIYSHMPLHLVTKKDDCRKQSSSRNRLDY